MNSDNAAEIMSPDVTITLPRSKETVTIKELNWQEQRRFLASLAPHVDRFAKVSPNGSIQVDQVALFATLLFTVGENLVTACTGKPSEWLMQLPGSDFPALLRPTVALNLPPDILGQFGVGKAPALTSPTPTTSSSASEDTQPPTSTPAP